MPDAERPDMQRRLKSVRLAIDVPLEFVAERLGVSVVDVAAIESAADASWFQSAWTLAYIAILWGRNSERTMQMLKIRNLEEAARKLGLVE